jgi:hypothetical protein
MSLLTKHSSGQRPDEQGGAQRHFHHPGHEGRTRCVETHGRSLREEAHLRSGKQPAWLAYLLIEAVIGVRPA